jgi:TolB protein
MKIKQVAVLIALLLSILFLTLPVFGQDWIRTGTGLGVEKVRLAVTDFPLNGDAQSASLRTTFNEVLWSDLTQAGIFDMVSKSFYPLGNFGQPSDIQLNAWSAPPPNAAMLAFGNMAVANGNLSVQGWLYDVRNAQNPQVLGKQYGDAATDQNARVIAHRFANEIIYRLGGGIQGITETKIYFSSTRGAHREIWSMDYDGANQQQITKLGSMSLQPRISPDNSRLAFATYAKGGPDIVMYSFDLGRLVNFPRFGGTTITPAWTSDGTRIAFSSSRAGNPNIFVCDASGGSLKRLTSGNGPDVSPVWNPKTDGQIAFVSGRTGLPQIYSMDADGSNLQRLTNEGYAVSPSWSPNGQFLAFAWIRHYGPGAPGAQDIYIMDIASRRWVQLTHDGGRNDYPSWSPDGRHIVFQSNRTGREEIWTMLADGSQQRQLTNNGVNTQPNWSWK